MTATAIPPPDSLTPTSPLTARNLPSLTGLRWFAALAVFGVHVGVVEPTWAVDLSHAGVLGVSFFFLLSGFVLAWSSEPDDTAKRFYVRRFARIYPLYLTCWILGATLATWDSTGLDSGRFLVGIPAVQSWVPDSNTIFGVNGPQWSLSSEAFFYLLFPLTISVLRRLTTRTLAVVAAAALVVMATIDLVASSRATGIQLAGASTPWAWAVYIFPPTRFLEFLIGCAVGLALRRGTGLRVPLLPALGLVAASYLAIAFGLGLDSNAAAWITVIPFVLLIVAAAQCDIAGASTWFAGRWLVRLGQWSFAFYLVHVQLIHLVNLVRIQWGIPSGLDRFAFMAPIDLAASIAIAAALHYWIERPLERRIRARVTPSRALPVSS